MSMQVGPGISINIHVTSDTDGMASREYVDEKIQEAERGEIKTVNGAAPDENGNVQVSGLPEGATAYQQLVTDGEGNVKWEDRTHYEIPAQRIVLAENVTYTWVEGQAQGFSQELAQQNELLLQLETVDIMFDGILYENLTMMWSHGDGEYVFGLESDCPMYISRYGEIYIRNWNYVGAHTFSVYAAIPARVKPLPETFLPTTVPVIQSAQVGQTVVVKAVDESGKPTEWEAMGGSHPTFIVRCTSSTGNSFETDIAFKDLKAAIQKQDTGNCSMTIALRNWTSIDPSTERANGTSGVLRSLGVYAIFGTMEGIVKYTAGCYATFIDMLNMANGVIVLKLSDDGNGGTEVTRVT